MRRTAGFPWRVLLALVLALALPATVAGGSAAELTVTLETDRTSPEIGEPALFTATASEPDVGYEFFVDDGPSESPDQGEPGRFTRAFSTAGEHKVTVRVSNESLDEAYDSVTVTVVSSLRASVKQRTEHPGAPYTGEPVTFEASATGGREPISYRWDYGGDGTIDATGPTTTRTFSESGAHRTQLLAGDAASPQHTDVVDVTTRVAPGTRPPACVNEFRWGVAEIKTTGCFQPTPSGNAWTIGDAGIDLNGIPIRPESGRTVTVTPPSAAHPGGHIQSSLGVILAGDAILYRAPLELSLPDGGPGQFADLERLKVYDRATLFYLALRGRFTIRLKRGTDDRYSAEIPVTIEMPYPIRDAPPKLKGSWPTPKPVTSVTTLHFSEGRLRHENLRLETPSAWYFGIPLGHLCLSYVGAAATERPCEPLTLDDEPYLECAQPVRQARWDGTLRLELPTAARPVLGAFTTVSGGRVTALGAFRDNFAGPGLSLKLADLWGLNRLGFGLCTDPVRLRGDLGIAILPNRVTSPPLAIDGTFHYIPIHKIGPLLVPGSMLFEGVAEMFNKKVGTATVALLENMMGFTLASDLNFGGVLKVKGGLSGWIESPSGKFTVEGKSVRGCVDTVCAPGAEGIVSDVGVGACLSVGKVKIFGKTIRVKAGGGTKWSDPTDIKVVAGRCGFNRYRSVGARAAAAGTFAVTEAMPAMTVRLAGRSAPPRVRVTGPGFDVSSPEGGGSTLQDGSFALIEDRGTNSTHLVLINRRPGTYSVDALDSENPVTAIETADLARPFTWTAKVRRARKGRRVLRLRYRKPAGTTIKLVERGERTARVLEERVAGRPCRPGSKRSCFTRRFRPGAGAKGRRTIQAVLAQDGIPAETHDVATFRARGDRVPSKPRVRMRRTRSRVRIAWSRSRRADSYAVVARLSDGRRLSFRPGRRCRTVAIDDVGRRVRVRARVGGLRRDLRAGRYAGAKLKPRKRNAGRRTVRLRRPCE